MIPNASGISEPFNSIVLDFISLNKCALARSFLIKTCNAHLPLDV